MRRVPYVARPGLMTPRTKYVDANTTMISINFDILRSILFQAMRNRQKAFSDAVPSRKDPTVMLVTERPIDNDFPCPIEDRLRLLASYVKGQTPDEIARQALFGLYNTWIDIHTLHQYMIFLSPDNQKQQASSNREGTNLTKEEAELLAEAKMDLSE